MTCTKDWFIHLDETFVHNVKLGNDVRLSVRGIRDIRFEVEGVTQVVTNVYYVPELTSNLLSVGQLQEKGLIITIRDGVCKIEHPHRGLIVTSHMTRNRMFLVRGTMKPLVDNCFKVDGEGIRQIWHRRFGHLNHKSIRIMQYRHLVKGLPLEAESTNVCEVCNMGKQHRENMPKRSNWRASKRLELIHTDLCGPISPASPSGKRYVLVFIDDFSRKNWVYFLSRKSDSFETFKKFKALVETETGEKIKGLRSDRGGEFTSKAFNEFCEDHGIKRQFTPAFTPQHNGVAERRNRTIMNMVRCLLVEKSLPKWLWSEAGNWASHIVNRCATSALEDKVPEEAWSGKRPNVDYFKIFGCLCYVHVPTQLRSKLDDRSHKCIFLGISTESKAYRCYDPIARKIIISRDVCFEEEESWVWIKQELGDADLIIPDEENDESEQQNDQNTEGGTEEQQIQDQNQEVQPLTPNVSTNETTGNTGSESNERTASSNTHEGRQRRNITRPAWMQDYDVGDGSLEEEADFALISSTQDPISFDQASKESKWMRAMESEIESIERNKTWELTELPKGSKSIGVKWVYKTKLNEKGEVDKYKARLVVKGYTQRYGVDYGEVFAPVARWDTVRTLLALAAQRRWVVNQLDVKSAFLHGELEETVFVDQPQGFTKPGEEGKVYRLKKALYGLKQAPRTWFKRIEGYFKNEGFERSRYDTTLFIKRRLNKCVIVSLYVDDLIYTGNDASFCENFKQSMQREFEMTDLGKMRYFLGVEVQQEEGRISICQKKYAREVLERFGLWKGNVVKNPMVSRCDTYKRCAWKRCGSNGV
ncbi:putative RNA-directed DNA polymerase [Helianthus debilis subsp. tardiflorus]